ncbi:response regulator transcription factor [Paenibacillus sp. OAS669]|uniref:response regulator transcription factor n=1 Tax=Paenibacillus sp. OAS669 TaxID=2663821 RepID=UPI00178C0F6F|nr:response regulator [Paenibacillus sp. OAS669]MBE1446245.1 CheY-like chemotaxis protein [Paenibacillus sp. OAS669]
MKASLLTQSVGSDHLYHQINQVLQSSEGWSSCGVITALSRMLSSIELQDLETRLKMEDLNLMVLTEYEANEGLLTILLPGQSLSFTHYLAITVKAFLHDAGLLSGSLAVASFPESSLLTPEAIRDFVALIEDGDRTGHEIAIYSGQPARASVPSIVMVEPNGDLQEFLHMRLGHRGYDVHPAQDGLEGLRLIESVKPDLVLTELMLPALDGYQLIHRVSQSDQAPDCQVVVMTDLGVEQDVYKCFELGVADIIRKPFSPVELEARLRRLLA